MIKGTVKVTYVHVEVKGSAKELAEDLLRLTKAIYMSMMDNDGPLKLNAASFRYEIMTNLDHAMREVNDEYKLS